MPPCLEDLDRDRLLAVAHEHMLSGMIVTRSMMPLVVLSGGDMDLMNQVAIDEWMGASPVYTGRIRRLMRIEGDDVAAIMKHLQLDVGFVHQYMDVGYRVDRPDYGEFWLAHCGALLDAEPHGEDRVFGMCHTIEDPTFDATALASNPRARIRPIHRPPRTPPDRHPHCHWTITIDPANDPVGPIELTQRVEVLPLATVPNDLPADRDRTGMSDYAGELRPQFRLADLSDAALVAVAREFQIQAFLLMASTDLALAGHFAADVVDAIMRDAWLGAGWIASERLVRLLGPAATAAETLAAVIALTPMLPPGCRRSVEVEGDRVRVTLDAAHPGLFDPAHPGWTGRFAGGLTSGVEGITRGVDPGARVAEFTATSSGAEFVVATGGDTDPEPEPAVVALNRIGLVAGWHFADAPGATRGARLDGVAHRHEAGGGVGRVGFEPT
jgi:hypothetical protein